VDFDVNTPLTGFINTFDVFTTPLGGTIVGAGAPSLAEFYGLGTTATFTLADGLTFANIDPDVFRNRDPNGSTGDFSNSFVFFVNTIAPGGSVHLTSKR
jgi:hypothetical protein